MDSEKRYVYGIIEDESFTLEVDGVNGTESVYTVGQRPHAAVVSDVETMDPEQSEENVAAHDEVLRTVMMGEDERTVIPMRFGMVFKSDRALKGVLRNGRMAFTKALRDVQRKVELGVKVITPAERNVNASEIRNVVERELEPLSEGVSEGDQFSDRLLINRSYLVDRAEQEAFTDAIEWVRKADENATVQYTGPWAPYSFVDIEIGVKQ